MHTLLYIHIRSGKYILWRWLRKVCTLSRTNTNLKLRINCDIVFCVLCVSCRVRCLHKPPARKLSHKLTKASNNLRSERKETTMTTPRPIMSFNGRESALDVYSIHKKFTRRVHRYRNVSKCSFFVFQRDKYLNRCMCKHCCVTRAVANCIPLTSIRSSFRPARLALRCTSSANGDSVACPVIANINFV